MACTLPLFAESAQAAVAKTLPPVAGGFDYQIGAPYAPAAGVKIVSRDHAANPVPNLYNVCYINAFQTQPGASGDWAENLMLHTTPNGPKVEDPDWPGEYMLDVRTPANRAAILEQVKVWINECAAKGFDAIEPDNYDHYTRSDGLIDPKDSEEYMKLLVQYAHSKNLAIAQKNTLELAGDAASLGLDFAIVEECGVIWPGSSTPECPEYYAAFGNRIIDIEYTDAGMARACKAYSSVFSIVQRDVQVTAGGTRKTCPGGGSTDTQAPSVPSGLSATGSTGSSVSLSWSASTDNVGVAGYDVYRNGTKVGSASGTSYTDSGLTAATTYQYQVKARDAAGNVSAGSTTVSKATTSSASTDTQAPSVPSGLSATGSTGSSVSLSWSASTDNVGVAGYDVYRNGTKVGSASGTSYTDSGLTAATTYQYQVKARDAAGNVSAGSTTVSKATTSSSPQGGCTATLVVTDSWTGAFDAEVRVKNTGSAATRSWKVTWTWPGSQKVTESWDTKLTQSGSAVTATNDAYNGVIAPAGTKALGLTASSSVPSVLPTVTCAAS
ncbi:endo alpha-1,4 polygalactosaminidase [Streptomyces sp. RKAG293]|uniref:endo alpha-1,4 polygalactosaminidase n=1 Tax=Streptomyces sp. RKAG293 TaxID=2893403 RepID=UPI002554DEF8|nr:endo alpha-1,4 polygalactosaminidase [Streptomyces sp. RKAG293]